MEAQLLLVVPVELGPVCGLVQSSGGHVAVVKRRSLGRLKDEALRAVATLGKSVVPLLQEQRTELGQEGDASLRPFRLEREKLRRLIRFGAGQLVLDSDQVGLKVDVVP